MTTIINQKSKKIKLKFKSFFQSDIFFYIILMILVALTSFLLGRFSIQNNLSENKILLQTEPEKQKNIILVASKNGSVYHFPWCAGALRLKEENKIFFKNKIEAEKAGYKKAKNCEGL